MKNHEFQELVDQNLSGLVWDERRRQKVLHAISEEEKPVKKLTTTFILVTAVLLITVTALASGLVFSKRVDASKAAEQALANRYGITDNMLNTFFGRTIKEQADGSTAIVYSGNHGLHFVLGDYTVVLKDGNATVSWSHDGENTSGLFDAEAWGREQLEEMILLVKRDHEVTAFAEKAREIAEKHGAVSQNRLPDGEVDVKTGEAEALAAAKASKYTEKDLLALARDAVITAYDFTPEQAEMLKLVTELEEMTSDTDGYMYYHMQDGKPILTIMLSMRQKTSADPNLHAPFSEKDGVYWVDINVETGVIENVLYDTQLGGNG